MKTVKQVAEILGCKPYRISSAIDRGVIPQPQQYGGRRFFSEVEISAIADYFQRLDRKKRKK